VTATVWAGLKDGLIVSCQAADGDPLRRPGIIAALAEAAVLGGAVAIRANSVADVRAIRAVVSCPIIALEKRMFGSIQCITPTAADALRLLDAGASIVAVEATQQRKEVVIGGEAEPFERVLDALHRTMQYVVMADVSTLAEGIAAADAGADLVATTLSGYTPQSPTHEGPDFKLLHALARAVPVPVLAEGRIWTPEQAVRARALGAYAVVVGGAITRPRAITERFVSALDEARR